MEIENMKHDTRKWINQTPTLASPMHQPVELMVLADESVRNDMDPNDLPPSFRGMIFNVHEGLARLAIEYVDDGSGDELYVMEPWASDLDDIEGFVEELEELNGPF
jgi:hypothetical protein